MYLNTDGRIRSCELSYLEYKIPESELEELAKQGKFMDDDQIEVGEDECAMMALDKPKVTITNHHDMKKTYRAPNGKYFTVLDLLTAVTKFEKYARNHGPYWFGAPDIHHRFLEGIEIDGSKVTTDWGS